MLFTQIFKKVSKKQEAKVLIFNYTLDIGLNDKYTLKQKIPTEKAIEIIQDNALSICGGYTMRQCDGAYIMNSGDKVQEKSIQLDIKFTTETKIYQLIEILKNELNQESIGLKTEEVDYKYL